MNTPTPRTDAAVKLTFAAGHNTVCPNFARTLERELTAEREKAERYRLATLKQDAALAAEREKVRTLRLACDQICEEWGIDHDANPIGAGQRMSTRAGKALEATEDGA